MLLSGISLSAFASSGYAKDGLAFMLFFVGCLLVLAGLFAGTDYLIKHRKILVQRFSAFIRKTITRLHSHYPMVITDAEETC